MTRVEQEIRRSLLYKLRLSIAAEQQAVRKTYLLGLKAGELMKGDSQSDREELQRNYEEAARFGVQIQFNQEESNETRNK